MYSTHVQKNINDVKKLSKLYSVLSVDEQTTIEYGNIKVALRKKGKPIPENDILIAAVAQQHGLTLVSRDAHFNEVDTLSLEVW